MKITTIGTGSKGNAYILTSEDGKHLLLDAGLPIMEIKKGLDFDVGNLQGCIVTHSHQDHSMSAQKLETMGIRVFRPYLMEQEILKTTMGDFRITSFPVPHNGTECRGFLIVADNKAVLYATDFEYIKYRFKSKMLDAMLIECNYQADRMTAENEHRNHVFPGHCELSTCRDFVAENATNELKTVILCHASNSGGLDKYYAVETVQAAVPQAKVYMARKGLTVDI